MMKKWNPSPANYATALSAELEREDETEGLPLPVVMSVNEADVATRTPPSKEGGM